MGIWGQQNKFQGDLNAKSQKKKWLSAYACFARGWSAAVCAPPPVVIPIRQAEKMNEPAELFSSNTVTDILFDLDTEKINSTKIS